MPEDAVDKLAPPVSDDADIEQNAAGGPREIPQVSINRSTVAELERRRLVRLQTASLTILAVAVVLCLIFVAKLILVVLLVSVLLSFVLAPVVDFLVVQQVPRAVASFIAVALLVMATLAATYVSYSRAIDFAHELPKYKSHIKGIVDKVRKQAEELESTTEVVIPPPAEKAVPVTVQQGDSWTDMLTRNAGAVSELALTLTFVPFLVYFMLSWKDHVRTASVMLFSMENRNTAYVMLGLISGMIRSFIVGNFIIGVFLSVCSMAAFGLMGLPYFYFVGVISGFLSLIPYLGPILAIVPPLFVDIGHITLPSVILTFIIVIGLHLIAMNVLYPKILGKRLQLNPLALTISLLFWGWMWGASGLILAVPITGAAKIIFDHVERLRPFGTWLGE
ncbi:MAG: AI-2E family transporter [Acidobacteriota bacterium]|nr:AI-2E family transporter [Acidobacteriota bacterium]